MTASISNGKVVVSWSGVPSPAPTDWFGISLRSGSDNVYTDWTYASSCTKSVAATGKTSGTCQMNAPSVGGVYQVRMYSAGGFGRLGVSAAITVST